MARIGFITGGSAFAREVFLREDRGYWSQALPLALEKHGLLGLTTLGPGLLGRTEYLDRFDAVLVARLPDGAWTEPIVRRLLEGETPVLVEGPLAPSCAEALGVRSGGVVDARGWLRPDSQTLGKLAGAYGIRPFGEVNQTVSRPLPRPAELEWSHLGVPISDAQADAWRVPGWDFHRWRLSGNPDVLAQWVSADDPADKFPAIVQQGSLIGCSLSLFAYLGQAHTSEPFPPGDNRTSPRVTGMEALLLGLIDAMHAQSGATRARVMPWPRPGRWVRSIRHDFDRPLSARRTRQVLDGHRSAGTAATWYWRSRYASAEALKLVCAQPRHEIALHTERPWAEAETERREIEAAVGVTLVGTSAHGAAGFFRYQGAPNLLWADRQGFGYTEVLQQRHLHPHRFAFLEPDGVISPLRVICLPHHESFDRSTSTNDTFAEEIDGALARWIGCGGLCQIMNHPDINEKQLFDYLGSMPDEGRLDWTAAEAADWWSRTHVRGELALTAVGGGHFRVHARRGAKGLVVELLQVDGTRLELALDLEPDRPSVVSSAEAITGWEALSSGFRDAITSYHSERGAVSQTSALKATIRTNTELVPQRADNLMELLSEMAETDLSGRRVLELGCGFGALATYLAWAAGPSQLVAADMRQDFVTIGSRIAEQAGLDDRLRFVVADMRDLEGLAADQPFDVIIANNSFIYLPTARDAEQALREMHRVLAPGGLLLFYHANKWRWREPFTKAPVVHLLPRSCADVASRAFGWQHSHGRVRLVSPSELRRRVGRLGFDDIRVVGVGKGRHSDGWRRHFGSFYALSARRST